LRSKPGDRTEPSETTSRTFKLTLEYDGAAFFGWQVQPDRRTVQSEVERAIEHVTGKRVRIQGASRTDAGVHALGQVASFACATRLSAAALAKALNAVLPSDAAVLSCVEAESDFHARHDARGKHYAYRILNRAAPSPLERDRSFHVRESLDVAAMDEAARHVLGEHDFRAFETEATLRRRELEEKGRPSEKASVRTVTDVRVRRSGSLVVLDIAGTGFLYNMVRSLAGTLVQVGRGRRPPSDLAAIVASRQRARAGPTAPPRGLFLVEVFYDEEAKLPREAEGSSFHLGGKPREEEALEVVLSKP
jgi:tRNA pseudouridine38-40 synthase